MKHTRSLATSAGSLSRHRVLSSSSALVLRRASTVSHDDHHHDSHEDGAYTTESFFTPFWRNALIVTLFGYGLYSYAPEPVSKDGQESKIRAWIRQSLTPTEIWQQRNESHLTLSKTAADAKWLSGTAQRPPIHRYRYYGAFEDASPHNVPVGDTSADTSGLVIKTEQRTKL
ncbi:hypothetical protein FRC02_000130 [Tulasnella sp. 418]|nr:hypothetical protein FRC02_000130 [Tulasnella sp. 418]